MNAAWKWFALVGLVFVIAIPVMALRRAHATSVPAAPLESVRPGVPAEALAPARSAKDRIEETERRMVDEDRALALAIERMEGGKFVPAEHQATVAAFRTYVQALRGVASDLIAHHREFVAIQKEYRAALLAAPAQFRDASKLFREYAASEPFLELRTEYEKLASDWLTLSSLVERRAVTVDRDDRTRDWGDTLRYCERTALFLERLDAHLESFPVNFYSGALRERHMADLAAYVQGFEALRRHLKSYRENSETVPCRPTSGSASRPR